MESLSANFLKTALREKKNEVQQTLVTPSDSSDTQDWPMHVNGHASGAELRNPSIAGNQYVGEMEKPALCPALRPGES